MSTHPLERRRVRPVGRGLQPRRVAVWCGAIVLVFAIAFGIGHMRRPAGTVVERTPPPLPAVATPVPAALASAPAIKLAVIQPPPPKHSTPANSSQPAATPVVTPSVTPSTPVTSTPAPTPTVTPTPAPVESKPAAPPAPAPHSSGGSSGGSGSGTSFESSG
jgi:hypothetical protein